LRKTPKKPKTTPREKKRIGEEGKEKDAKGHFDVDQGRKKTALLNNDFFNVQRVVRKRHTTPTKTNEKKELLRTKKNEPEEEKRKKMKK
jgi:hypothetical protein